MHTATEHMTGLDHGLPYVESSTMSFPAERPLSCDEIDGFREELQHLRHWLVESIAQLEARGMRSGVQRTVSFESTTMDERGWDNIVTQRSISDKRLLLAEIMAAFERIRENTYGRCVSDDQTIPRTLLEEVPWARYCAHCANRQAD